MIDNEDLQYGSVEPDGYIVFSAMSEAVGVLLWLAFWAIVGIPYLIYKRYRRNHP